MSSHTRPTPCTAANASIELRFACFATTGCPECFRSVYDTVEPAIRSRVANALRDPDDVDDLTSEIFARVLRARSKYDPRLPLMNWLNRITSNAIKNAIRSRTRNRFVPYSVLDGGDEARLPSNLEGPERTTERADIMRRVGQFLSGLPETFQEAFQLHHAQGMTYREIGNALGVRPGTVKTRAYRSCRHLRRQMGQPLLEFLREEVYSG